MLTRDQQQFRDQFLSPFKQRFYYIKSLPMALISGIRLIHLDETKSVSEIPYRWVNKNPFDSMYFAVQSMAAELSTAAPVILALKGVDADVAFIIVKIKADFVKKAQSKVVFSCQDYGKVCRAIMNLKEPGDTVEVKLKTTGRDINNDVVATFYFSWSFKLRS